MELPGGELRGGELLGVAIRLFCLFIVVVLIAYYLRSISLFICVY